MELGLIFFMLGLTVNANSENYQSLQTESMTYPAALPSKDQNNFSHNSRKASTESLSRLSAALIASPGTDLFHVPDERHLSTTVNAMTATAEEVISSTGERFVSNQGLSSFTLRENSTSTMQLFSGAGLPLIPDEKKEESIVTTVQTGSELVMNSTTTAAAHLSRGREKIAASLHAPLNSTNQRAMESITLLPAKSIPMLSASDPVVIDNLGEPTETMERQSINENETLKSLGTTNPQNATESIVTDGEKSFVQKGSTTIMRLTAVLNRTRLATESSAAGGKMVALESGEGFENGQSSWKNMPALSLLTRHDAVVDVDTPLPLGSSSQAVVKDTAESTKSLTTKGHTSIMRVYTNIMDEKLRNSIFSQTSNLPSPKPEKLRVTRSFVTSPLTPHMLQRIVSAGDKSEGEPTSRSTSAGDRQVGMTIHSPQPSQSPTLVKDEGGLKFLSVLSSKFTDRPSVLIKVKHSTQPKNSLLVAPQNISFIEKDYFHLSELSIENRTLYPQGNDKNPDKLSLIDTKHIHTLINILMSGASSTTPFAISGRLMTESAQSRNDSDPTVHSGRILTQLTPSSLITSARNMHHPTSDHPDQLQKLPTTSFQTPARKIQNLSPIFEGHAVTYSPVRQLLIPFRGSVKPLNFLSSPASHTSFQSTSVLRKHSLISPLGNSASIPTSVTFRDLKKAQDLTSFHPANKNREPTMFPKLLTSHSERLIRTTNTWPVTRKGSVNSSVTQFTRTADKGGTLLQKVSSVTPALHSNHINVPTTTALTENIATLSFLNKKQELFFFTLSLQKTLQKIMPASATQDSVSHLRHAAAIPTLSSVTERNVINGSMFTNQKLLIKQTREKDVSHGVHVLSSAGNKSGRLEEKTTREMFLGTLSTHSPLKQQSELNRSTVGKGERSADSVVLDQNIQCTFNMQNENQTPLTVLPPNTVSSSQSQGQDLQKTTGGQINASVSPAAIESFQSTQPLAFPVTAETPKMVEQMINQASSLSSTLSSIITAASNGKDINVPQLAYQTTQHAASVRDHFQQAASSQASSTIQAIKRHTINISAIKPLTLSPSTSPAPKPSLESMKSALPTGGLYMQPTSQSLPSTPPRSLTDFLATLTAYPRVSQPHPQVSYDEIENVKKEHFTQTMLPSVTEGTFFPFNRTYVSLAGLEITATETSQTGSLHLSEESKGHLSTIIPFQSDQANSAELMSDLPVMQRKMRVASPDFLSGLAQISDDNCGSGNYTAEMRLTLERDIMPGDLIPALGNLHVVINLKTNNTQVNLEIKSCCLSPTVRLDEFNTTCCLFSRLPIDPQGIHLLPSLLSKRASFTISLFQMINYSTAYLHCDLSVCLRNNSECERCQQHRNAHYTNDNEVVFSSRGNRISFGPVLKETDDSPFIETTKGLDGAEMAVILSSVSGCFLVCIALLLLWTIYKHHLDRSGHGHCWTLQSCPHNGEEFLP